MMAAAEQCARTALNARAMQMTVLVQQVELIAWYERLGYHPTGETRPFPADARFARPQRDGLLFIVLGKQLGPPPADS